MTKIILLFLVVCNCLICSSTEISKEVLTANTWKVIYPDFTGRKIYIIPLALDKSLAVKYLQGIYKDERFITAGDSDVDKKFVLLGDIRIIPRHSSIELKNAVITKQAGALAAEDILEYCIKSNDLIPE